MHHPFIHQTLANRIGVMAANAKTHQDTFKNPILQKAVQDLANAVLICTIGQLKVDKRSEPHEQLDLVKTMLVCVGTKFPLDYVRAIANVLDRCEGVWHELKV